MSHDHSHSHENGISGRKLLWATLLNFIITIAEVIGGILSNSLSLISDALHNFSDGIAVFIAFIANRVGRKSSNFKKTFGYKRIEILAALLNAIVLIVISIYLFIEAYERFIHPEEIEGKLMFIVALIGLLANLLSVLLLHKDSHKNLNIKAAYLHLLGDTFSSIAVIIGGILIHYYKLYWIDPLITVLIGLYIIKETWQILKESVNILMQSTPADLNLNQLTRDVNAITEISNIHHIHAWNLDDKQVHFECHIELNKDYKLSEIEQIRIQVEKMLYEKYNINHVTIQFGFNCCDNKDLINKTF
ncbi:MAG: cation transporter [Bacteroidales bacterium]|nr:cation transporter [Bacteroidales bacterium]